jgi:hypothetical protein
MRVKCIGWVGTRTTEYPALGAFLQAVLGLTTSQQEADFAAFQLPEEAPSRCSALGDQDHEHSSTSPVVGFWSTISPPRCGSWRQSGWSSWAGRWTSAAAGWRHFALNRVRRTGPFQPSPGSLYGLIGHMGLADGLTCGQVPPPHLGVLAAAGKIRRIRGTSGGTTPQDALQPRAGAVQAGSRPPGGLDGRPDRAAIGQAQLAGRPRSDLGHDDEPSTAADREHLADTRGRVFLAAYGQS